MLRWSELLCNLLLVTIYEGVKSINCPSTSSEWERASHGFQCQDHNYYHCLRDENGVITEQCLSPILIQPKKCPEFNQKVSKIDVFGCPEPDCPASVYQSNAVFMYPICFENISAPSPTKSVSTVTTTLHEISTDKTTLGSVEYHGDDSSTDNLSLAAIVGITIGVIVICLFGVLIILAMVYKRRRQNTDTDNEEQADENIRSEDNKLSEGQAAGNVRSEDNKLSEEVKNESEINEASELLGNESSTECKKSIKDACEVYVVENRKPKKQTSVQQHENSVRVLVLVLNKPINRVEMNSKAMKTFGPKYDYCWTLSYYQNHRHKESISLFQQNFDFQNVSVKGIFEMIRDVVTKTEVDVNFVITMPLIMWSSHRDELFPFLNEDKNICFKSEYW